MTTDKVAALAAALREAYIGCHPTQAGMQRFFAALEAAGLTIAPTAACDHCAEGWPRYHEGPEDPEGIEGRQRVPCSA